MKPDCYPERWIHLVPAAVKFGVMKVEGARKTDTRFIDSVEWVTKSMSDSDSFQLYTSPAGKLSLQEDSSLRERKVSVIS